MTISNILFYDPENPKSISGNRINAIYEDQDQILWFGTWNGLNRYDYNTNSFTRFQHDPDDSTTISSNVVESIFEDSHGTFWVGTRNGLNIMDRETGKFIHFLPDENDSNAISSDDIRVIFEDTFGELWFGGTYLEKLNRKDTSFIHYLPNPDRYKRFKSKLCLGTLLKMIPLIFGWLLYMEVVLSSCNRNESSIYCINIQIMDYPAIHINAIEIDDKGFIWASTNQGLSRIDPHDYSIRNFDVADGLVNLEFIERSSYKDDDGWLYFGGRDGLTFFIRIV